MLFGREREGGASLREAASLAPPQNVPSRRTVAAALSAAVTITKFIGEHSHFQAEPPMQKQNSQTPAALREGARGRGFSQRSRLPRTPTKRTFTSHGRGGSVSRRDLNQLAGNRAQLAGAYSLRKESTRTPAALREGARGRGFSQRSRLPRIPRTFLIPSYSSGEGVWGRGASLREAASPPASNSHLFPDMFHALVEHRANVAVGEGVENDFALAAALDQTSLLE